MISCPCAVILTLLAYAFLSSRISITILTMVSVCALMLFGCIDPKDVLSCFANSSAILMASMFIVSAGLNRTQMVKKVSAAICRIAKGSFTKVLAGYVLLTAILVQFIPSAVACFAVVFPLALGVIPSPSRNKDMRAAFVRNWMAANGFQNVSIDKAKNVIAEYGCEGKDSLLVFAAHTDVVFPDTESLPLKEDDEKLYAPGIGDDTSNLVNLLLAARYIIHHHISFPFGILFVANACEEGLGNLDGTKALFETYGRKIKAFYSFDGYLSQCTNCSVGSYRYRVSCSTQGGHSYLNFGRTNAIEVLCRLVEKLYAIEVPTEERTTYNVGVIEGGSTVNSIAQRASLLYEFRSPSQICLEKMEEKFAAAVDSVRDSDREIVVELLGVRPGNGPIDAQQLQDFTAHSADVISTFFSGELDYQAYSTDSNIPLSLGIPGNTIGTVSGALAHTRDEWISKKSLNTGLKIALSLMLRAASEALF
jgi:acetylornithine deacetylase/succinyl-diaminopimelate desuccinylase-like protein